MSFLNEERLALYDRLIKEHCLNHNDLLNKIYEIKHYGSQWICEDQDFFSINDNKIIIVQFAEEITVSQNEYGTAQSLTIRYSADTCNWGWNNSRTLTYYQTIPMGYSLLFKFEGSNDYKILSHTQEKNDIPQKLYNAYTLEQGGDSQEYILCADQSLFQEEPPEIFIGYAAYDLNADRGILGYPDDSCSWGISREYERFSIYCVNNIIPAGYNLFVQRSRDSSGNKAAYILISSSSGGGDSLPSGSEGEFMVYTNGSWQGKTITVGGSY